MLSLDTDKIDTFNYLEELIINDKFNEFKEAIEIKDMSIYVTDKYNNNLLHVAVNYEKIQFIKYFFNKKNYLTYECNRYNKSPLLLSIINKNLEIFGIIYFNSMELFKETNYRKSIFYYIEENKLNNYHNIIIDNIKNYKLYKVERPVFTKNYFNNLIIYDNKEIYNNLLKVISNKENYKYVYYYFYTDLFLYSFKNNKEYYVNKFKEIIGFNYAIVSQKILKEFFTYPEEINKKYINKLLFYFNDNIDLNTIVYKIRKNPFDGTMKKVEKNYYDINSSSIIFEMFDSTIGLRNNSDFMLKLINYNNEIKNYSFINYLINKKIIDSKNLKNIKREEFIDISKVNKTNENKMIKSFFYYNSKKIIQYENRLEIVIDDNKSNILIRDLDINCKIKIISNKLLIISKANIQIFNIKGDKIEEYRKIKNSEFLDASRNYNTFLFKQDNTYKLYNLENDSVYEIKQGDYENYGFFKDIVWFKDEDKYLTFSLNGVYNLEYSNYIDKSKLLNFYYIDDYCGTLKLKFKCLDFTMTLLDLDFYIDDLKILDFNNLIILYNRNKLIIYNPFNLDEEWILELDNEDEIIDIYCDKKRIYVKTSKNTFYVYS